MISLAVVAVAAALVGEPVVPKSDEVFFGRVVVRAPAVASDASLFVGDRRVARRSVLARRVTFSLHGRPRRCDVRVRWERNGRVVGRSVARRAWLLHSSAGQAIPERRRDRALSARLGALGRAYLGYAAVWVHDLHTGRTAAWNSDASFPAASIVKLAVLIAALDRFGPRPERSAAWPDIRAMAAWSDNRATNRLLVRLGGSEWAGSTIAQRVLDRIGATSSTFTGPYEVEPYADSDQPRPLPILAYRRTTAHDVGRILYALHAAALGRPAAARRTGLSRHEARVGLALLLSSVRSGDNAGILRPAGPAAQKQGWTTNVRHTAAILYGTDGPEIVVVLTFRPDEVSYSASLAFGRRVLAVLRG
ncbi:MAG TPA: serine hydrolase [Gaiellaceae bacterium]|nr:serine hydrolase [Gaiellaceae bacterium]